jgi:hypothetical protein
MRHDPAGFVEIAEDGAKASALETFECVRGLALYYPDIVRWYWDKVVPGVGDRTRLVRTVRREGKIVAVLICKRTDTERKICTLWVDESQRNAGLGVRLLKEGCRWLGTGTPSATVPEERLAEFADILVRMGIPYRGAVASPYRDGKTEHLFGGS